MQIFLKNESDKAITVTLDGSNYTLLPNKQKSAYINTIHAELSVAADSNDIKDYVASKIGLNYFHRFSVISKYSTILTDGATVRFYAEAAHGNNFESYLRIYPFCKECKFSSPFYTVKNAEELKIQIAQNDKNEVVILQGAGLAGKLFKAKNTFDDIITALILGAIALVVFILVWIFKDFKTAAIYGGIAVFGFLLWKLILERALKKAKQKAKHKAEEKLEKMFLPCDNMPEGIFKTKDSYFDNDYISAVFKHSKKRI